MQRKFVLIAGALGLALTLSACTGPGLVRGGTQLGPHGTLPDLSATHGVQTNSSESRQNVGDGLGDISMSSNNMEAPNDLVPSDPVDLINMWRVTASGESPDTWLRLVPGGWDLWRSCGPISGGWQASGTAFVASNAFMGQAGCDFDSWVVPWLSEAAAYQPVSDGFVLLGMDGRELARLRVDGLPPSHPNVWDGMREPPEVTEQVRTALSEPPPLFKRTGIMAPITQQLVGRWNAIGFFNTNPFITFSADGTWGGSDGCNSVEGVWRLDDDGRLLATTGAQTDIGCQGVPVGSWMANVGRVGLLPPGHDTLILFDRSGNELGRFTRE